MNIVYVNSFWIFGFMRIRNWLNWKKLIIWSYSYFANSLVICISLIMSSMNSNLMIIGTYRYTTRLKYRSTQFHLNNFSMKNQFYQWFDKNFKNCIFFIFLSILILICQLIACWHLVITSVYDSSSSSLLKISIR